MLNVILCFSFNIIYTMYCFAKISCGFYIYSIYQYLVPTYTYSYTEYNIFFKTFSSLRFYDNIFGVCILYVFSFFFFFLITYFILKEKMVTLFWLSYCKIYNTFASVWLDTQKNLTKESKNRKKKKTNEMWTKMRKNEKEKLWKYGICAL